MLMVSGGKLAFEKSLIESVPFVNVKLTQPTEFLIAIRQVIIAVVRGYLLIAVARGCSFLASANFRHIGGEPLVR